MYNHIEVTLVAFERTQDTDGYEVLVPYETVLVGFEKSVKYNEFYTALQAGIKPTRVVFLYNLEYEEAYHNGNEPEVCIIDGIRHKIVRVYSTDAYRCEITLEKEMHNG